MLKKYLCCFFAFIFLSTVAFSQGLHIGAKGGTDIQKIDGNNFNSKFAFGYHFGGFVQFKLSSTFAIQPELYYSEVNFDTANNFSQTYQSIDISKIKFGYLNLPILLNINLSKKFALQAGPRFGILSKSNLSVKDQAKDAIKSGDIAMVGGVQIKLSSLYVYGRYQVGLNNINDAISSDKWKSQSLHIGVALKLF
jgi:hypothetical protein